MSDFVLLAQAYKPVNLANFFISEKLDGVRAVWDGGVSRGLSVKDVRYANMEKDDRDHICTGLWSRKGKVIHAPDWFLDALPVGRLLDGELWNGYNQFQNIVSIVRRLTPDERWESIFYHVWDSPSYDNWICKGYWGREKETRFKVPDSTHPLTRFESVRISGNGVVIPVPQFTVKNEQELEERAQRVYDKGGEGLILRAKHSLWVPKRSKSMLKYKDVQDAEATIVGMTKGEGKYADTMGALIVNWNDKTFKIGTGFNDQERRSFNVGDNIRFKYRRLSDNGTPIEARFDTKL